MQNWYWKKIVIISLKNKFVNDKYQIKMVLLIFKISLNSIHSTKNN